MGTINFCKKSKHQIKDELITMSFSEPQAQQIIDRMEDQIRDDKKSPTDNFKDYCFDVDYSKTDNGLNCNNVKVL